jgi:putative membrane protein
MRLILRWIVNAVALALTIWILEQIDQALHLKGQMAQWTAGSSAGGAVIALFAVVIMAIVNALIRPIVTFLTLPLSCATFGLFAFVINAVMFWLVGELSDAFRVDWRGALLGSIIMGIVSGIANHLIVSPRES